jgi:hypothetical protein
MKTLIAIALVGLGLQLSGQALASGETESCSTRMLAGRWVFATGIGHQALGPPLPPPADITAIGTMNIRRNGFLEGLFDVTFEGAAFRPGVLYSGTVIVNEDCTGTLSIVTAAGSSRTDSILVVDRNEIWAMSQDPKNLWTYRARRLPGR